MPSVSSHCLRLALARMRFECMLLASGAWFLSPDLPPPYMCFTRFKRKLARRANRTSSLRAGVTGRLRVDHERTHH